MDWKSRALSNLAPHSMEQENLKRILGEWFYTGNAYDLESPCETCELCDHADIRYQFEIENEYTHDQLLVGSECIKRVGIGAIDEEGGRTSAGNAASRLDRDRSKLITDAKQKRVINTLVVLAADEDQEDFPIDSLISWYQENGNFSPKQLALIAWRLEASGCAHRASDFKMTIRKRKHQDQLRQMADWKIGKLLPYMTPSQKKWCQDRSLA